MTRSPSRSHPPRARRPRRPAAARSTAPRRVLVVTGSVGAGHDGAAYELAARLRAAGTDVDVRDYLDALPRAARHLLRDGYTLSVGRVPAVFEWLFRGIERRGVVHRLVLAFCHLAERTVRGWLAAQRYDVIVSTYPLASQTLGRLRADGRLSVPVLTYLTDPAVHRSWLHPAVDAHLTVTAAAAEQGARDYGVELQVAGPLVPEAFLRRHAPTERAALRAELGLPATGPVALVVTGSLGLGDVTASVEDLLACGVGALVLCGRNEGLRRRLARLEGCVALGWRDDVPALMAVCDVLVHNAGGLSFTEAYVAGLPAVSYRCIPGHGLANARVLADAGLAPWARDRAGLADALADRLSLGRHVDSHPDPARLLLQVLAVDATVSRAA